MKSWLKTQHSKNEDHGIWSHYFMGNKRGKCGNSVRFYFLGLQNHCSQWLQPWNEKTLAPGLGRSSGRGHGDPLQYSYLENPYRQRCLAGCSPWGYKELNMTGWVSTQLLRRKADKPRQRIKKQRHHFDSKGLYS